MRLCAVAITTVSLLIAAPPPGHAQEARSDEPPVTKADLDALRRETDEKLAELKTSYDEQIANLEQSLASNADDRNRRLNIYGFFDLTLAKYIVGPDSAMNNLVNENLSFVMSRLNLYFARQLTDSLSAMAEIEFRFQPNGAETSLLPTYEREDTTVRDPYTAENMRLGGLRIQRVHLTYQPFEFFGVLAGYFLTPYGIWNVDHGSPVITTIRNPYLQDHELLPQHQLGVQLQGTVHPAQKFQVFYALTLSNGRGPMDEVYDLDDNKAIGLRLRGEAQGDRVQAAIGGYGYFGDYTDISKQVMNVDPFTINATKTDRHTETLGALDVQLSFAGLKLQGEYARMKKTYAVRPLRDASSGVPGYQPDHVGKSCYAQIAYTLPLKSVLGERPLTPYFQAEYANIDESVSLYESYIFLGGLNFKPSAYVTIKAEGTRLVSVKGSTLDAWMIAGQTAVSF